MGHPWPELPWGCLHRDLLHHQHTPVSAAVNSAPLLGHAGSSLEEMSQSWLGTCPSGLSKSPRSFSPCFFPPLPFIFLHSQVSVGYFREISAKLGRFEGSWWSNLQRRGEGAGPAGCLPRRTKSKPEETAAQADPTQSTRGSSLTLLPSPAPWPFPL